MENLIEERKLRLNNIDRIVSHAAYLKTYFENDPVSDDFEIVQD
jgi:hypothetical protein